MPMNEKSNSQQNISGPEAGFSGPVKTARESESPAIRNAPAYDTEQAKCLIPYMPELRKLADGIRDEMGMTVFGSVSPSAEAFYDLRTEIGKLTAGNHKVSLIMADVRTRSGVAYRSAMPMCSQSTIKGIYIGALLESIPAAFRENGQYMHDAIVYSSNAPYESLKKIYGDGPLEKWCAETGVDPDFARALYPRNKTVRDMFKMWTRLYCFLNGAAAGSEFASWFADSRASAAKEKLGGRFPVQTKAGWECGLDEDADYDPEAVIPARFTDGDPANDECAINDTGVVYTEDGPYLFAVYTDHPYGVFPNHVFRNPLCDLTEALYKVQKSIAARSAENGKK